MLSNLPGVIYRCKYDTDWTMKYLSEGCVDLTGYEPSELIDNEKIAWADIIHPEDREKVRGDVQESIKQKDLFKITYRILTKGGKERWVWEHGKTIKDQNGNIKAIEGFITDITERVEAKKKIEEREKKVRELYEASGELERCRTKQEVYDLVLGAAEDILGFYTCGILMEEEGELVVKAKTEKSALEREDRFPIDEGLLGHTFMIGESSLVRDVSKRSDVKASMDILKSGIDVPIGDKGVLLTASDEAEYYDEFDLEMGDILASHMCEVIERIESEKEKSLILDTTEELIVYQDTNFNIKWVNRAAAKSVNKEIDELIGKKCYDIWHDREEPCERCPVKRALETGEQEEGEISSPEGRSWLIRATPDLDEEGEIKGMVEVALDITERVKAREQLEERKEKMEGFLEATSKLEKQHEMDDIYQVAIEAIENILEIDLGAIFILEEDKLVLKAETSRVPSHDIEAREIDDGVLGKTFKTKETDITDDIQSSEEANLHFEEYKSGISVPIGDFGVFQAMSKEKGNFDDQDLNMLELLSNHINEARERVKFHKKLEKSEKKYRTIFENTGTAMCIIEKDKTVSLANEKFKKITGFSSDELKEDKKWTKFVLDEEREKMKEFHQHRREGDEEAPNQYSFKGINRFGDMRHFWMQIDMIPETKKAVASLMDITDYRKTFGALRESQEAFRTLFENSKDPIMLIEKNKTIKEVNDQFADLFDKSGNDLIGKSCNEIIHPDFSKKAEKKLEELFSVEKDQIELDIIFESEDEKTIPVEADVNLVKDSSGDPLYAIGICTRR